VFQWTREGGEGSWKTKKEEDPGIMRVGPRNEKNVDHYVRGKLAPGGGELAGRINTRRGKKNWTKAEGAWKSFQLVKDSTRSYRGSDKLRKAYRE